MGARCLVEDFNLFGGLHCETGAVQKVFQYHGLPVSEEMLFGLAGGIGFTYWFTKGMPAPLVGGRGEGRDFIANIARRTGATIEPKRTSSPKRGHTWLMESLAARNPSVIYADIAYLPYMAAGKGHFGQHVIVVYGVDENEDVVYISDRGRRGVTVTVADLRRARGSKFPPWPPKHTLLNIRLPQQSRISPKTVREALRGCVDAMLNPPISNLGLKGIQKWAKLISKWPEMFEGANLWAALMSGFTYIETAGTGGSAFRPMFNRFLQEAGDLLGERRLGLVAEKYQESARLWSEVASLMLPDGYPALHKARDLLWEKDKVFLAQEPGATERLLELNHELDAMLDEILVELEKASAFLPDVQQRILQLYDLEKEAIHLLRQAIS